MTERKREDLPVTKAVDLTAMPARADDRFRLIMESAPVGMATLTSDGRYQDANQALCRMLGRNRESLIATAVEEVTHPDDLAADYDLYDQLLRGDIPSYRLRKRYLRPDGAVVWGDLFVSCIREVDGTPREIISQVVDVTAEMEAERLFRENEARLQAIMDSASDAIITGDVHSRIVGWNRAAERMFGCTKEEALGLPAATFMPERDAARASDGFKRLRQGSETGITGRTMEGVARRRDGSLFPIELSFSQWSVGGERYMTTIIRDATLRRAEQDALRESRRLLANAVEGSGVGLWDWYVQTGEMVFNQRLAEIIGYTLEELEPVSIETWRRFAHPDDLQRSKALLAQHFSGQAAMYECETRMRHKDGHWVWVLDRGRVFERDEDGRPLRMTGTLLDITERRGAQEELREHERRLQSIIDTTPDVIAVYDLKMRRTTLVNKAVERVFGHDRALFAELREQVGQLLLPPDQLDALRQKIGQLLAAPVGEVVEWEMTGRSAQGDRVWLHTRATVFDTNQRGEPTSVLVTATDVTSEHRVQAALTRSAQRLRAVMDTMLDPHLLLEAVRDDRDAIVDFTIADANPAACALLGSSLEEVQGARIMERFPAFGLRAFENQRRVVETGEPLVLDDVLSSFDSAGEEYRLDIRSVPFGDGVSIVMRDATARHRAEADLHRRLAELDALQQLSALLVQRADLTDALDSALHLIATLFAGQMVRVRVRSREPGRFASEYVARLRDECEVEHLTAVEGLEATLDRVGTSTAVCADGSPILAVPLIAHDVVIGALQIVRANGSPFTEREQALAETISDLIAAVIQLEQLHESETREVAHLERRRIARDLHDAVTQSIYSAMLLTEGLSADWESDPERGRRDVELIRRLIRSAFAELRILLYELRPETLAVAPLDTLFERLCEALAGQGEMSVDLRLPSGLRLPDDVRMAFYRVAQEALNNVGKYADAAHVGVSLDDMDDEVTLVVSDDGCGFVREATRPSSMGLAIMEERAAGIGATLTIDSTPGAGTTIRLVWSRPAGDARQ